MNTEPDWSHYRSFLAVVEERSLSGAARRLGLTQPTVARHIGALEQAIGAALFSRSQRGLVPTETALDIKPHAELMASTASALVRTASGRDGDVRGVVRVSASEVVGVEHLPPILAGLRERHPRLVLELVLSNAVDDVLHREADIAVRLVAPTQDALIARRMAPIVLGLHAHRSYIERRGMPASVAELPAHDLIGFDRETSLTRAVMRQMPGVDRSSIALRVDSDLGQLAAIRAGFGIGVCQALVARREPELVRVLAEAVSMDLGVWIVMHESLKTSARCRTVFDALVDGLAALQRLGDGYLQPTALAM